jgi:tripartite-type tricarboxylate transporter receptor subunit TctC
LFLFCSFSAQQDTLPNGHPKEFSAMPTKRHVIQSLAALALAGSAAFAAAQSFPTHPITMVVPFPPGGSTDIIARTIAEKMTADLKQTVIVDNKQGAGGNTGADIVAKARPDGYTILLSSAGPLAINQHLYAKQGYDPLKDFAPVSYVALVPIMLVVNPQRPFGTVQELIAYAKANPGKLSYGSQGNGTTSHLTMELLKRQAGIDIAHVPYRGSAPASNDLMGGQIDLMFDNSPSTLPFVQAKRMKALGVASPKRVHGMDDIPSISETVKGFESVAWFGVVAPAGTPDAIVSALNKSINNALAATDVKARMFAVGVELIGGPPSNLKKQMTQESAKWGDVIKQTGIKFD